MTNKQKREILIDKRRVLYAFYDFFKEERKYWELSDQNLFDQELIRVRTKIKNAFLWDIVRMGVIIDTLYLGKVLGKKQKDLKACFSDWNSILKDITILEKIVVHIKNLSVSAEEILSEFKNMVEHQKEYSKHLEIFIDYK